MSGPGRLQLRGVGKDFGRATALHGLDLDLVPGGVTTLLGPSGCGTTTALRIIAGFLEPDRGEVVLDGRPLAGLPPFKRDTAMVFQDFALFPHMNVAGNVGYGLQFRGVKGREADRRVAEMLEFLQLDGFRDRMPHELSGGQQQRVALGRALAVRPRVLLMDEPLSNLDARLRARLRSEIRAIQRELQVTTVFVTHDQQEALTLSDSIAVMNLGRLIEHGSPRELYGLPRTRFTADVLGDANFLQPESVTDSEVVVAGQRIPVRRASGSLPENPWLLVRPGWLQTAPAGDGALRLDGRIEAREFQGNSERLRVRLDRLPQAIDFDLAPEQATELAEGAAITLWLPAGRGVLVAG